MNVREAIFMAAAHLEANPLRHDFFNGRVPRHDSACCCPIAWVCYFADASGDVYATSSPVGIGFFDLGAFAEAQGFNTDMGDDKSWAAHAHNAAQVLRLSADSDIWQKRDTVRA